MKRFFTLTILVTVLSAGILNAQSKTVIKINPLSLAVLTLNVQGEHSFAPKMSAQLGFFYGGFKFGASALGTGAKVAYNWLGITPEFRYYIFSPDEAPNGFYVGPFLRFQRVQAKYSVQYSYYDQNSGTTQYGEGNVAATLPAFGGGAVVGYQAILGEHFALDAYIGPSFYGGNWKTTVDFDESYQYTAAQLRGGFSGFALRFGLSLGVAF